MSNTIISDRCTGLYQTVMYFSRRFDIINLPLYIVCIVGSVANFMLLIAFVKDPLKCFRNPAAYLVGNLALSDMIFNVLFVAFVTQNIENDIADFFMYFSFYSSMATIFSIALDRFLMITYPFKHRILMSKKKMAMWIAVIWCLSSVHPFKKVFAPSVFDAIVKPCFGSVSIILTGILYGRTYFALKKQSTSMLGRRNVSSSSSQSGNTPKKVNSIDRETSASEVEFVDMEDNNEYAQDANTRAQTQGIRAQNQAIRAQTQGIRAQNQAIRAQNQAIRAHTRSIHTQLPIKDLGAQNWSERAEGEHQSAQSEDERAQNKHKRAESHRKCVQNKDKRAQDDENERVQSQNKRVDCTEIQLDIREKLTANTSHICSTDHKNTSLQNPPCQTHKKPQSVDNAKEQRFLNTIIIIALIAVFTVLAGTIYAQIHLIIFKKSPELSKILKPVLLSIYCLNFTVNPFVYCLRLKQYRKTFKIVYCCRF